MLQRLVLWLIIFLVFLAIYINVPRLEGNFTIRIPAVRFFSQTLIPGTSLNLFDYFGRYPLKLGLDLQGGIQLVLETKMEAIEEVRRDEALESAREVMERRVNLFGVSESVVQSSRLGDKRRILVDLPGIKDASAAANLVGRTAQLDFRQMPASPSAEATASGIPLVFFFEPTGLTGADLKRSSVTFNATKGARSGAQVAIEFTPEGAKKFAEITKRNTQKPLGIFLDDEPLSLNPPIVSEEIVGGNAVISGNFTTEEAKQLSIQLNAGALPVPIEIVEQRLIGASLGQESINKSLIAGVIGIIIVMTYMALYYGRLGLVACLALIIYTVIVLAIFRTGLFILPPITLTLAGIAGFILSIGMAVDANILIFERMKEEKRWGKSTKTALELGFNRAWSSIRDSNISSLITAGILYFFGTGLVRGFAVTLAIGVLVSMFTAIVVTRRILRLIT